MGHASLVICTRNRARSLETCLGRFLAGNKGHAAELEVLIVDNGSSDDTRAVVERLAGASSLRVVYLREDRAGKSRALNLGVRTARGEVVLCTDDDCIPADDWVQRCLAEFEADPELGLIGGRVELADPDDAPVALSLGRERRVYRSIFDVDPGPAIIGANMAFRRALFGEIGGFDTRLGPGTRGSSAEDYDFVYRAIRAGEKVAYVPDAVVRHRHGRRTETDVRAARIGYAVGRGAFYGKYAVRDREVRKSAYWHIRHVLQAPERRPEVPGSMQLIGLYCKGAISRLL
mgnify:CR=1 FL=1